MSTSAIPSSSAPQPQQPETDERPGAPPAAASTDDVEIAADDVGATALAERLGEQEAGGES